MKRSVARDDNSTSSDLTNEMEAEAEKEKEGEAEEKEVAWREATTRQSEEQNEADEEGAREELRSISGGRC